MRLLLVAAGAALSLSACASITKGTTQSITINTNPPGARCELTRDGELIGVADPTPQIVTVDKSSDDIQLACKLAGHVTASHVIESGAEAMTAGNVIFGGVIGLAIDAGTGALNKYDANVTVVLQPEPAAPSS